jgi:hypothetical protein
MWYFELMVVVKKRMKGGEKIMYHYKEHWNVHQVHGRSKRCNGQFLGLMHCKEVVTWVGESNSCN